jgi:hypothetical protein
MPGETDPTALMLERHASQGPTLQHEVLRPSTGRATSSVAPSDDAGRCRLQRTHLGTHARSWDGERRSDPHSVTKYVTDYRRFRGVGTEPLGSWPLHTGRDAAKRPSVFHGQSTLRGRIEGSSALPLSARGTSPPRIRRPHSHHWQACSRSPPRGPLPPRPMSRH